MKLVIAGSYEEFIKYARSQETYPLNGLHNHSYYSPRDFVSFEPEEFIFVGTYDKSILSRDMYLSHIVMRSKGAKITYA